ncbi:glycosyltransferase family 2 protein [Desulfohalovibrio reitneri]|uniref:glycosyltransferase family 2 protein n=1 Tax=Desulfohalovibrio reitneri TaxID=1307759 RepID=UPI0023511F22|nr:glycosyltransferase family 2 protein [Desulfohalovibrio reitneri]
MAEARASRLGHGGGSLIYSGYEGYASPVSNGAAYSRRALDRVGLVDESFDACEDVEFNHRVERAGLRTYTSPALTVRYYPRESFSSLLRQMVRYGEGRCRLWRKHPSSLSATTLVPPLFAAGAAAAPVGLAASAIGALPMWLGAALPPGWPPTLCW